MKTGDPVTNPGGVCEPVTNTGEPVTNTGEPVTNTGEPVTNTGGPVTNIGDPVTNTGDQVTNTGDQVTSIGEPDSSVGEQITNSEHDCDLVTNSEGTGDKVHNRDSTGEPIIHPEALVDLTTTLSPVARSPAATAKRKLNLDFLGGESSEECGDLVNIVLNTASKPAGRPREKKSMKKAKRRKEFEETKSFVRQINTHGDITLSDVLDCVNQKKLSLEKVEPVINAINPRHNDAIYKRPKGHVVTPGTTKSIETNIRFVLPQILVKKAQTAGLNAVFREHSISGRTPPREDIIISILEVGTFSLTDIDAMHEWHCLKKKISATRKLIKWIMTKPETETRGVIISRVSKMNMFSAFKSKVGETIVQFDDLTRFA
ncbi:hypothetical protein PR003_g31988, partial [Phytophthora rubi]